MGGVGVGRRARPPTHPPTHPPPPPAGLTEISYEAFSGCTSLRTLTILSDLAEPRVLTRGPEETTT